MGKLPYKVINQKREPTKVDGYLPWSDSHPHKQKSHECKNNKIPSVIPTWERNTKVKKQPQNIEDSITKPSNKRTILQQNDTIVEVEETTDSNINGRPGSYYDYQYERVSETTQLSTFPRP